MIEPHHLDGMAALAAAQSTPLKKQKGERDTEFVRRIVCAYMNAHMGMEVARASARALRENEWKAPTQSKAEGG